MLRLRRRSARPLNVYQSLGATIEQISLPHAKYAVAAYYIIAPCEASSNLARYDGVRFGRRAEQGSGVRGQGSGKSGQWSVAGGQCEAISGQWPVASGQIDANCKLPVSNPQSLIPNPSSLEQMYCQSRSEGFGDEVKRRIMLGAYALSAGYYDAYYQKALKVRRLIRQDFDRAFERVDLLIGPVTPTPAFKLGERIDDLLAMYLFDLYTVSTNLAGIAGMSIPCGFSSTGLPIGLHLQSPPFEEDRLLRAAAMFQRATDWHARQPKMKGLGIRDWGLGIGD